MRVVQIIGDVHNLSAGPTYSVVRLADELYKLGLDASVMTLGQAPVEWPYKTPLRIHEGEVERKTGISLSLIREIRELSGKPCILHGHSMWRLANNLFPLLINRDAPARIVCSPRGTMSAWSMRYKRIVKQPFWHLLQKPALQRCHCFHVTAPLEYNDVRRLGLHAPVAIIPNGVDIPYSKSHGARAKRIVFLGRIDPVKGIDILLPAWAAVANEFPEWELVIAGPLKGDYANSMQTLASELHAPKVRFTGVVHGEAKYSLLSGASLFVLPTYSENFGMAVAEALAHGVPVITTTETPWAEIGKRRCGWCITPDQAVLRETLREALSLPLPALHEMGQNGRNWMQRDYAWEHIAEMMKQTYEWLLEGAAKPDFVIED